MARRPRTPSTFAHPDAWSRGRLLTVLASAAALTGLLLTGIGLSVFYTLQPAHRPVPAAAVQVGGVSGHAPEPTAPAVAGGDRQLEDALADRAMPAANLDAALPGPVSTRDPGVIVIPAATRTGPAEVPTGFPHTPAGALAQLAAIDQTAMSTGTLPGVRAVITGWAAPGGPTPQSWSAVKAMADLLTAAGLSGGGSAQLALVVTPLMGLIKGTVGADFVVPCVDFQFDATLQTTQHVADADCQRMVWQGSRWVIGPGPEPATPPSVWADTDLAITVGYRDLRHD